MCNGRGRIAGLARPAPEARNCECHVVVCWCEAA